MIATGARLDWAIALAGLALALLLTIAGAIVLARRAFALKKRLNAYRDLPVFEAVARADVLFARVPFTIAKATDLVARSQRAAADLKLARARLVGSMRAIGGSFGAR